jgi:hypothetical protein
MLRPSHFAALLGLFLLCAVAPAQLAPEEKKALSDTLFLNNLTLRDLDFHRRSGKIAYPIQLIEDCLDKPLEGADRVMALHQKALLAMPSEVIRMARMDILGDQAESRQPLMLTETEHVPTTIPSTIQPIIERYARAVDRANAYVHVALKDLSPAEKRALVDGLPVLATQYQAQKFTFTKTRALDREHLLVLLAKVNLPLIRRAGEVLSHEIESDLPALKAAARRSQWAGSQKFTFGQIGVMVSGVGDDLHQETGIQLLVDLGGKNRYTTRQGVGVLGASVAIDCGGDSSFTQADLGAGCGLLGIGLAYDLGGNCTFRSGSLAFGCGIGGVGVLYKEGGDDTYSSSKLSQGFGLFGVGALVDTGGDDKYLADSCAQGSASTQGIGWLVDRSGNDLYSLTGVAGAGQAYAGGTLADGGGVGLLTDASGNDTFAGTVKCQSASENGALASLYTGQGDDKYVAQGSAQSYAVNEGVAYMFDLQGNDSYTISEGSGLGYAGEDAVALLLDRGGNDFYSALNARPGQGLNRGLGIFLDAQGTDRYSVEATGVAFDSLGLFVDMDGDDSFAEGLKPGSALVRPGTGITFDAVTNPRHTVAGLAVSRPPVTPGTKGMPTNATLESIVAKATSTSRTEKEQDDALDDLVSIGMPALQWLLDRKLSDATPEQETLIGRVARDIGQQGRDALALQIMGKDDSRALHALEICTDQEIKEAGPLVSGVMQRPLLTRVAARAAGVFRNREAVPQLMALTAGQDRVTGTIALRSLVTIGDPQALSTAQALLNSGDYLMKQAALDLIGELPGGEDIGKEMILNPDERVARMGIQILAKFGTADDLNRIGALLSAVSSGVRIQALTALKGRVPDAFKQKVADLQNDPSPLVRLVAKGITS